jgi:hypothetical protein
MRRVSLNRVAVNMISTPAGVPSVTGHTVVDLPFMFCFVAFSYCDKDSFHVLHQVGISALEKLYI